MIELVTGCGASDHISSRDAGAYNAGTYGSGRYVLSTGEKFAYTINSVNSITIGSGDLVMDGRHVTMTLNDSQAVSIANGSQGMLRNDLICVHYKMSPAGIETATLEVLKGTPGATAADPSYTAGNILNGDDEAWMPLYRVAINGLSLASITPLFEVVEPIMVQILAFTNPASGNSKPTASTAGRLYYQLSKTGNTMVEWRKFGDTWYRQGEAIIEESTPSQPSQPDNPGTDTPSQPSNPTETVYSGTRNVTTTGVNIRKTPSGTLVGTLPANTPFYVSSVSGDWSYGTVSGDSSYKGTKGYVFTKYLKVSPLK